MEIDNSLKEVDKPLVSILLAVYKPNETWLIEQLISLNEQTYENIELLIYDDCPNFPVDESLIRKYITRFSYSLIRGTKNEGSNKAFEELTKQGNGELFAYCDQDDIWEDNKISVMMERFNNKNVTLVCCDLCTIDENSIKTHESIRDIRKRIIYKSGYNLAKDLLISNFVTGCAMIVKKKIAMKAVPFINEIVHDQWIAIIAALNGKIEFVDKPLVKYRQHSNNQTTILKDVYDKKSYYINKIENYVKRYESYIMRIGNNCEINNYVYKCLEWIEARKGYFLKPNIKDLLIMVKYRRFNKEYIILEIFLPFMPNRVFKKIIKLTKKGLL